MNGVIYIVTSADVENLISAQNQGNLTLEEKGIILRFAKCSRVYAGIYNCELLCLIGLAPETIMADDRAYMWMFTTDAGRDHRLILARHAKKFITNMKQIHTKILGHCFEPISARWLKSLGATFTSPSTFEIV